MSDEYSTERSYSAFWPTLIFLIAFLVSSTYQICVVGAHCHFISGQLEAAKPNLEKANEAQTRLVALANDLLSTAAKNNNAAMIVREAKQAGIIRDNPKAADTNAAPANP